VWAPGSAEGKFVADQRDYLGGEACAIVGSGQRDIEEREAGANDFARVGCSACHISYRRSSRECPIGHGLTPAQARLLCSLTRIVKVPGVPPICSTIEKARAAANGA
jgi:hypothetical protein